MSTPGTSDDSIKIWLKTGDIEKLEEAVINGYGDQLRNKTSRIPKINHFLKQVPHFQSKIDAIHEAVAQGKLREVQSLLDRKKLAMCRSQTGASPLHTAVLNNQTSIAKYILEKFPTAIQARDNQGRTALHYAAVTSDEGEMYKILLEYGADKKATDMRGKIPEYYLQNPEEMPLKNLRDGAISKVTRRNDKRNDRGRNTDTTSISVPSKIEVRMLIQKADLNKLEAIVLNGYGDRLLGESSVNSRVKEFLDQVPEFMIKVANLHTAAVEGSLRDVRNLLDRRTLAIARDPYGANVLHRSVVHNHHNIVKYLVHNYPETINTTDFDGRTPLHYSVAVEDERIYKTLIGAGADESIKDNKGNTAIYYKEHPEELDLLEMQNRINRMRSRMQAIKKSSSNHRQRYGGGLRVTRANIRKWIHAEDLEKLNQVVFEGHGTKLLVETSSSAKVKEFLKTVPNLIGTIRDVNQAAQEGNLAQLQEITDNKQLFLSKDIAGISPLHRAVIMGHRDISKYIVQECPDSVKAKDHEGKTPLHYAAALPKDDNFIYNMLLEAGGDIQQLDEKGKSPEYYQQHPAEAELRATMIKINRKLPEIHVSSYTTQRRTKPPSTLRVTKNSNKSLRGIDFNTLSPEHVTKLISKGDVDKLEQLVLEGYGKKLYGKTSWIEDVRNFLKKVPAYMDRIYAVHKATAKGDLRQVEELMDNKKLVIAKDERGLTPLHRAVKYGKTDIVKYMLQMYPEAVHVKDKEGRTPLHLAGMYKDRNVEYKLLENFGSDVTLVDSKSKTPQEYQQSNMKLEVMTPQSVDDNEEKEKPNDLTAEELEDENNINQWIANDDLDRLEQLIVDGKGDLLLGKSSSKEKTKDFLECVPTTMGKIRAIHNATVENDLRGLQSLLDKRVYASSRDSFGACPLHIALLHGHSDVIRYLGNGFPASLNVQDIDGRTPLHYAAVANDEGMSYRFLHKHGADPNIKDKSGSTPGHYLRGRAGALALDDLLKRYEEKKIPPRPPSVQTWQRPPTAEILRALTPDEEENENDESTATLTETQTQDESETHFDASPLTEDTKSDELAIASEETQSNDEQKDELNPENDKTKIDTDQAVDETPVTNTEEIAQESMEKSEEPLQESMEKSEEPPQEANEEAAQQPAQETSEKGIEEQPHEAPEEQTQKAKEEETEEPPEKDIEEQPQKTIKEATADTPQEETEETLQEATGETSQEATTETPQEGPGETPQETTEETPQETTEETPQEATGETLQEATGETPQEATVETPQEATGETPQEATVETPQEATVETPQKATVETPQEATRETPQEATRETPQEATVETPQEATVETPQEATRETPLEANKNLPKEISDKVINETSEEPSEKLTDENQTAESTELAAEPESVEKEPSTDDNNKKNEAHIAEVHKEQNEENVEESSKEMTEEVLKTNDDDHNTEIKVNEDTTEGNIENEPKQTADAKSEQNETATTEEETEEHITTAAMETLNEESIAATETKSATEETAETEAGHETPTKTNDNSKSTTPTPNGLRPKPLTRNHSSLSTIDNPMWSKEGEYLASAMGDALIKGLTEVSHRRPKDPISYLAVWLYLHEMRSVERPISPYLDREVEDDDPLMNSIGLEKEEMGKGLYEARLARSSSHRSSRGSISSPASYVNVIGRIKDESGKTILHFAAGMQHEENAFWNLLLYTNCSLAEKDVNYLTARDVAENAELVENVNAIDRFVGTLIINNKFDLIKELMLNCYEHILDVKDPVTQNDVLSTMEKQSKSDMFELLQNIKSFQEKVRKLHQVIVDGDLTKVKDVINEDLAIAKSPSAQCSLHIAVLHEQTQIIEYIASSFPDTLKTKDNMWRTPLHYAMGVENSQPIAKILIQHGASRQSRDVKFRTPSYYFVEPQEIANLISELSYRPSTVLEK